jgi:hypothetical protein
VKERLSQPAGSKFILREIRMAQRKRNSPASQRYKLEGRREKNKARKARKQEKIEAKHTKKREARKRERKRVA